MTKKILSTPIKDEDLEDLNVGDVVLAGSFTRPTPAQAGDTFHVDYGPLGSVAFRFV